MQADQRLINLVRNIFKLDKTLKQKYQDLLPFYNSYEKYISLIEEYKEEYEKLTKKDIEIRTQVRKNRLLVATRLRELLHLGLPEYPKDKYNVKVERTPDCTEEEYQEAVRFKDQSRNNFIERNKEICLRLGREFPSLPSDAVKMKFPILEMNEEERQIFKMIKEKYTLPVNSKNKIAENAVKMIAAVVDYIIKSIIDNDFNLFDITRIYFAIIQQSPTFQLILNHRDQDIKTVVDGYVCNLPTIGVKLRPNHTAWVIKYFRLGQKKNKDVHAIILGNLMSEIIFDLVWEFDSVHQNKTLTPNFVTCYFKKLSLKMKFVTPEEITRFNNMLDIMRDVNTRLKDRPEQ